MSKKILKRSLALGALMASIITGSAMAAEYESRQELNSGSFAATDIFKVNPSVTGNGGAIYNSGVITVNGSSFKENYLTHTSCCYGGAIYNASGAKLIITDSNFLDNKTKSTDSKDGQGGAIYNAGGTVNITGGSFKNNVAEGKDVFAMGGAIYNGGGSTLTVNGTTFENNKGCEGGAIVTNNAPVTIVDSVFVSNEATMTGGAINIQGTTGNGTVTLNGDNTFTNNKASQAGGAIKIYDHYNQDEDKTYYSTLEINGTATFTGNTANGVANDISNDGIVNIKKGAVVNLDGGIDGAGTTNIAGTLNGVFTATGDSANTVAFEKGGLWNMTGDSTVAKITGSGVNVNGDAVLTINGPLGNNGAVDVKELNIKSATNGISVYGDMTVTADKITVDGANSSIYTGYPYDKDTTASHLTINVKDSLEVTGTGHGINSGMSNAGSSVIINGENAEIEIKVGENAVVARGGDKGSIEITGKKVTLESTNTGDQGDAKGHAIYAQGENSNIVINATESLSVTAVAGKRAVSAVANGTDISLDGGKETIINGSIYADGKGNGKTDEMNITVKGTNITIDAEGNNRAVEVWSDYPNENTNDQIGVYLGDENTQKIDIKNFGVEQGEGKNETAAGLYVVYDGSFVDIKAKELNIISDKEIGTGSDGKPREVLGIYVESGTADTYRPESDSADDARVVISEDTVTTIDVKDVAIGALSEAKVEIKGDLFATAESVITARGGSSVVINKSGEKTVQLNGDIYFDYNESTSGTGIDATIDITLKGEDSWLKGSVAADGEAPEDKASVAGMKLGLFDGATWTVTDDSFVNTLVGTDGTVVLTTDIENKVLANVEIGSNQNANLTVSGDAALTEAIEAGKVKGEDAAKAVYNAVTNDGEDTKAIATFKTAEGEIVGSYVYNADGSVTEETNTTNDAIGEAGVALKAHWRAHMNDMNKRMGELRMANGETGVWTRMVRGESEYEGAKAQYNQYQLGYDEKLSVDKRWTVGAAVTFSEGDSTFGKGSTEDDSTAFAIYGSKLNNDGTFVDLIARYARLESDVTVGSATDDYSTNGYSVSAEFGKRIQQGNGLWIEPQVELTYGSVDSAEYVLDGKTVQAGDMDSLIGRIGFSLGKDIKQGNVYARASYLYDFEGETETAFSNASGLTRTIKEDLGGGWWEVGVGANINLSKATYIYADVEKTFGGEVDTNWQWNLGVRYSF